jgi:hypothetical protein
MTAPIRTKWMDQDFRRWPKTDRYCTMCHRDLAPGRACREVRWELDKYEAIHPDDWERASVEIPASRQAYGAVQRGLIGMDCARKLGLEWSREPIS